MRCRCAAEANNYLKGSISTGQQRKILAEAADVRQFVQLQPMALLLIPNPPPTYVQLCVIIVESTTLSSTFPALLDMAHNRCLWSACRTTRTHPAGTQSESKERSYLINVSFDHTENTKRTFRCCVSLRTHKMQKHFPNALFRPTTSQTGMHEQCAVQITHSSSSNSLSGGTQKVAQVCCTPKLFLPPQKRAHLNPCSLVAHLAHINAHRVENGVRPTLLPVISDSKDGSPAACSQSRPNSSESC
eukprot:scaffold124625_cov17-Tisochrysis_lutea.AAC.1